MLLCNNYDGGYHLFCLKPELIQVPIGIWYCSSCSPTTPWFLLRPCHTFHGSSLGGYMKISSQPPLVHCIYIYVHASLFGWRSERNYATCKNFWATTWIEMYVRIACIWKLLTQLCVLPAKLIKSKINTSGKLLPPRHCKPIFLERIHVLLQHCLAQIPNC